MPWQLFLAAFFIFGAAGALIRRTLARDFPHHNRLINAVNFVFFLTPAGLLLALLFPHDLNVGATNLILLLGGSIIWPIFVIIGFRANKTVGAGLYTLVLNLSPLFTLAVAIPFMGEHLTSWQFIGIVVLIISGIVAISPYVRMRDGDIIEGILLCLLTAAILGVATAYERFMLNRVDFGTYMILGWGSQVAWMAILAGREWKLLPELMRSVGLKTLTAYGLTSTLKSVGFILALFLSGSASIVSGASDFIPIVIILAAYFFLHERDHLARKFIAAGIGIVGLLLLTV